jgi:hypothetical protein
MFVPVPVAVTCQNQSSASHEFLYPSSFSCPASKVQVSDLMAPVVTDDSQAPLRVQSVAAADEEVVGKDGRENMERTIFHPVSLSMIQLIVIMASNFP